mmetsp:Transcript_21538/g.29303  ORF Transcript_21538/g.29303 Transcript_21538/m.29303 type:complete len:119 (-) Transcript_21538:112-468(-)
MSRIFKSAQRLTRGIYSKPFPFLKAVWCTIPPSEVQVLNGTVERRLVELSVDEVVLPTKPDCKDGPRLYLWGTISDRFLEVCSAVCAGIEQCKRRHERAGCFLLKGTGRIWEPCGHGV